MIWTGSRIIFALLLCVAAANGAAARDAGTVLPAKKVLILYPYGNNMPGFVDFDAGFRSSLTAVKDYGFEFHIECMDLMAFPGRHSHDKLMQSYQEKYSGLNVDLIVAALSPSLDFMAGYSPESSRNVPVLLIQQDPRLIGASPPACVAAVAAGKLDVEGTLTLALRLHPGTRGVYVVSGASRFDESLENMTREALRSFDGKVEIRYLSKLPMDELVQRAANLPEDSLLLYISVFQDGTGKAFISRDALAVLSRHTNSPIYSIVDTYIGSGTVGGHVLSYPILGAISGRLARSLLGGENPSASGSPNESANRYIFDVRELKRWGIAEDDLPPGSDLRYKEFSLWETHRWQVVAIVSILFFQALFISALVVTLRRQRRSDLTLRTVESKYRTIVDFTYDWESWTAPDGTLLHVSPACERISGYSARDFLNDPSLFSRIIEPEDLEIWGRHTHDSCVEGGSREIRMRIRTRDGDLRWIEHVCRPVFDEHGMFQGIRASNRDLTDRKRLEDEIRESSEEWRATFNATADRIMLLDHNLRIVRVNAAASAFLGTSSDGILGRNRCCMNHETYAAHQDCPLVKMLQTKRHEESILHEPTGDEWFFVTVDPILGDKEEIKGVVHTVKNITERKRAEEALKASEEFNRAVLASLKQGIAILDKDGVILAVNDAWGQFAVDNEPPSLAGQGPSTNYLEACRRSSGTSAASAGQILNGILSVLDGTRKNFSTDYVCDPPYESRWFSVRAVPFRSAGGGVVVSHSDITQRKAAELEAQMRREELTHMARIVSIGELASSLAHEINQPMTAILCNALAAQRFLSAASPDLQELRRILEDIVQDDKRAGEVVRRLRALAKKETPRYEPVSLNDVVRETMALVQNALLLGKVPIRNELDSSLPAVHADRVQLQQVILNMTMNAIAAMRDTPPALKLLVLTTAVRGNRMALFSIRDSGTGIAAKDLDRLFEPFYSTKAEGLGMGLSISRTIVKAHGGTIWAANNREGGATFYFTLPLNGVEQGR